MTTGITVTYPDQASSACDLKLDLVLRGGHNPSERVDNLDGHDRNVCRIGREFGAISDAQHGRGCAGGFPSCAKNEIAVFETVRLQDSGTILHLPLQMGILPNSLGAKALSVQK